MKEELDRATKQLSQTDELKQQLEELQQQLEREKKSGKELQTQNVKLRSLVKIGEDSLKAEMKRTDELLNQLKLKNGSAVSTPCLTTNGNDQDSVLSSISSSSLNREVSICCRHSDQLTALFRCRARMVTKRSHASLPLSKPFNESNTVSKLCPKKEVGSEGLLLGPLVRTFSVCADVVQPHVVLCTTRLALKEDSLSVSTFGAGVFFRFGKSRIVNHFRNNARQLVDFMSDLVHVHAVVVRDLLIVAVPTSIQKVPIVPILFGVQHVVAAHTRITSTQQDDVLTIPGRT